MNWWQQWKWFQKQGIGHWAFDRRWHHKTILYVQGINLSLGEFAIRRDWIEKL